MAQLRCSDVTLGYEGTAVMEHLSFSVSAGDYLYICLLYTSPSPRDA